MPLELSLQCRATYTNQEFVSDIIEPVLHHLTEIPFEIGAPQLLLGVALHESGGLKYRRQQGGGPALGFFQMERATHDDIWANFLRYKQSLAAQVRGLSLSDGTPPAESLVWNDNYAAAMCRVHFHRYKSVIPELGEISKQAALWKKVYNTIDGKGTVEKYMRDWRAHDGSSVTYRNYTPG